MLSTLGNRFGNPRAQRQRRAGANRTPILLAALIASFLLVPAASAFATPSAKVNITGTGSGEVESSSPSPTGNDPRRRKSHPRL